jgi:FKBP-type peptidyl-prolyl cis-trans isomerase FkpA
MKKTSVVILGAFAMLVLAACNGGGSFKRAKSGLLYKIISDKKSPVVKPGQILKFEFQQKIRDSVLNSSETTGPAYVAVDSTSIPDYNNPAEIFAMLRKGDSVVIVFEADTLRKRNPGGLPPFIKPKDKIALTMRVTNVFNTQEEAGQDREVAMMEAMKKQEAAGEVQKQKDIKILEEYVKSKGITVQKAPKGTLVEIINPGTGPSCDSGKFVSVMYTGQTLAGKVFDSSVDPKFGHPGQPYTFQIGGRGAITGWDDGLRFFKKGGKGRLFVPSTLGYGKQGAEPDIKPDENLIFDVEIVDVNDARPAPQQAPPSIDTTTRRR